MINNSYLLGLYGITTDTGSLIGSNTPAAKPKKTQPTAPWASTASATAPKASELVRAALAGRNIINEGSVELDLSGASSDYRKMFALYQGLNSLSALADRASVKGLTAAGRRPRSRPAMRWSGRRRPSRPHRFTRASPQARSPRSKATSSSR